MQKDTNLVAKGALKTIERCKSIILYERKDPERYGYKQDSIRDIQCLRI